MGHLSTADCSYISMMKYLFLLGLLGSVLCHGPRCSDDSRPTCSDGTRPQKPPRGQRGPPTCSDGGLPVRMESSLCVMMGALWCVVMALLWTPVAPTLPVTSLLASLSVGMTPGLPVEMELLVLLGLRA